MNAVAAELYQPIEWQTIDACPACGTQLPTPARLPDREYLFGDERILVPQDGIGIATCNECGLVSKTVLPSPESLAEVFRRQAGKKWMEPYDFRAESLEVQRWAETADLLDVGSGSGAFLAAMSRCPSAGRRSALDVVEHPGCKEQVRGEFILGLIDARPLQWSRQPYDIVTMFDVAEHLYDPPLAFLNLRELVRDGGLVVIETGNSDSDWPQRYGVHHWWYVRLFEHHMFWSRRSLERIAAQYGFQMLIWREQRHKAHTTRGTRRVLSDLAQMGLYRMARGAYPKIASALGKYWTQPWSPFARDHFRVVLRKL